MEKYHPVDATTNPTLLLKFIQTQEGKMLLKKAVESSKANHLSDHIRTISVDLGCKILNCIKGRVSTEVDPRLSHDTNATIDEARTLIEQYQKNGVSKERVLIKIASTWEGIQAARVLENDYGIHCNMTLIFSRMQAATCGECGVTIISPFVGRISDWFKKKGIKQEFIEDSGVKLVKDSQLYMKKCGHGTQVMGASFRNTEQIMNLVGVDYLTISPSLLQELSAIAIGSHSLPYLSTEYFLEPKIAKSKEEFYELLEQDEMAHELLNDGIKKFSEDLFSLERAINQLIRS